LMKGITKQLILLILVYNTSNYNKGETINNNLTNLPCQRRCNCGCHPHWTLLTITKHYSIFEL
jgi:hypothetical protein